MIEDLKNTKYRLGEDTPHEIIKSLELITSIQYHNEFELAPQHLEITYNNPYNANGLPYVNFSVSETIMSHTANTESECLNYILNDIACKSPHEMVTLPKEVEESDTMILFSRLGDNVARSSGRGRAQHIIGHSTTLNKLVIKNHGMRSMMKFSPLDHVPEDVIIMAYAGNDKIDRPIKINVKYDGTFTCSVNTKNFTSIKIENLHDVHFELGDNFYGC